MTTEHGQGVMPFYDVRDAHESDSWCTPPEEVARLHDFWPGGVDLDPCSNAHSLVPARVRWTIEDDAFCRPLTEWRARTCFVNPPYSDPRPWLEACQAIRAHSEVLALVKCDPSVSWWRDFVWSSDAVCFCYRRISFLCEGKPIAGNNFPSAYVYWGPRTGRLERVYSRAGKVVNL